MVVENEFNPDYTLLDVLQGLQLEIDQLQQENETLRQDLGKAHARIHWVKERLSDCEGVMVTLRKAGFTENGVDVFISE